MAVKTKKRKLNATTNKDQDELILQTIASTTSIVATTTTIVNTATDESELQRQEEEMLAANRLLKQVDREEALTFAKKILESNSTNEPLTTNTATIASTEMPPVLVALEVSNEDVTNIASVNGAVSVEHKVNGSSSRYSENTEETDLSDHSSRDSSCNDSSSDSSDSHSAQSVRAITTSQRQTNATEITSPSLAETRVSREIRFNPSMGPSSSPTDRAKININGIESKPIKGSKKQNGELKLAKLTVHSMQKMIDPQEQEECRLHDYDFINKVASDFDADSALPPASKRSIVSLLRSGLLKVDDDAELSILGDAEYHLTGDLKRPAKSGRGLSATSGTSTGFIASVISDPPVASDPSTPPNISVKLRPAGEVEVGPSSNGSSFDIPIAALIQPRLTKTLIQQKARSTYAPPTAIAPQQPRRRPGRPPGYFLGPTSCAYCRTQHRRCDFNTVCARCAKAKIPCDRSGTVDRPTIIVREARQQAKAEAAAALAAAVAAGLAVAPEKPRPTQRYTQLDALTREAASITARNSTPTPVPTTPTVTTASTTPTVPAASTASTTPTSPSMFTAPTEPTASASVEPTRSASAGVKRRRTSSPSDVSSQNIIERRAKRHAALAPIQKYDPSLYESKRRTRGSQTGYKKVNGVSNKGNVSEDDLSANEVTSAGSPSRKTNDLNLVGSARRGRATRATATATAAAAPTVVKGSVAKRTVGRPTNASKKDLQPIPAKPAKVDKGKSKSEKLKTSTTISTIPSKRGRDSNKAKSVKGEHVVEDSSDDDSVAGAKADEARLVKKVYLKSGLYSADLKVNPVNNTKLSVTLKKASKQSQTSKALTRRGARGVGPARSGSFFQLPINYGAVLMSNQSDFCLPFDIMQAWKAGLLRKAMQPEPFIKIRSNIFVERKRRTETSPMVCHCTPPPPGAGKVGCGEDCYNRVMFYECISAHCPCGDQCSNQRFQKKHDEDHLRVIWTQERGFGIQTMAPIKKGSLVIEYRGEVISQNECHRRMKTIYKNNKNFYFLEYEKGEVVDACQKGTNARFVNHSCSPNSQIEKWFLNGEMSIGIFASQDIPAGTEISYDYNFSSFSGAQKQKCRCGAPNCRGYIGERISKSKDLPATGSGSSLAFASVSQLPSGRSGKKADARKRKAGRRKVNDPEFNSVRFMQMPSIRQIRQRQSDKYKEGKMAAIRYTRLFLFRNIRLVESKYIKYAQTKSRSYQETVSRSWLMRARQRRKRNLESVVEDLRTTAQEKEDEKFRKMREEHSIDSSIADDDSSDPSVSVGVEERSTVSELDADDTIIYPGEGGKGNTNREDEKLSEDVAEDENYEIKDEDTDGSEQLDHDNIVSLGEETVYGDLW